MVHIEPAMSGLMTHRLLFQTIDAIALTHLLHLRGSIVNLSAETATGNHLRMHT